ncbi:MAG: UDP-3-O-[3-hydroxymyristoyl] N-acetylglucosamine deacetylase [Planctomycetes bacterium]|nr:UDP-3-O-[3-hydroxymyristoyl] N-acetylglucosamine deacetylase [Planctomycetota bacterium]
MPANQRTLQRPVTRAGPGLHLGEEARVTLLPAPPGAGILFARTDLPGSPEIPATEAYAVAGSRHQRRTMLRREEAEVHTVEHLLSAFYGLGVTNARVEIDRAELPGLDGSAQEWVRAIREAGEEDQGVPARHFVLPEAVALTESGVHLAALPQDGEGLTVSYTLDYGTPELGSQFFTARLTPEIYAEQIAPARTFCLSREADALRAAGLGRGANTANTLVIGPSGAPLDNAFRFPDEPVRHKVLDLIGDLALLGVDLRAHVIAIRSGHDTNGALVRRISRLLREREIAGAVEHESRLDIEDIMRILPHRYPFLLVDRVIERVGLHRAVGLKNVTIGDAFFQGHFPTKPIMPGVLQVEALAQLCGVLLMPKLKAEKSLAYLLSLDQCRFRRTVVPGDQLRLEVVTQKLKTRTAQCRGTASVASDVACEATMRFMIVG